MANTKDVGGRRAVLERLWPQVREELRLPAGTRFPESMEELDKHIDTRLKGDPEAFTVTATEFRAHFRTLGR